MMYSLSLWMIRVGIIVNRVDVSLLHHLPRHCIQQRIVGDAEQRVCQRRRSSRGRSSARATATRSACAATASAASASGSEHANDAERHREWFVVRIVEFQIATRRDLAAGEHVIRADECAVIPSRSDARLTVAGVRNGDSARGRTDVRNHQRQWREDRLG